MVVLFAYTAVEINIKVDSSSSSHIFISAGTLIILWFSKLVASDQHGLVMSSLGYLIYVQSMCQS